MEKFSEIRRFDVVVFQLADGTIYIKRVIGLPGETISYENVKNMEMDYMQQEQEALKQKI